MYSGRMCTRLLLCFPCGHWGLGDAFTWYFIHFGIICTFFNKPIFFLQLKISLSSWKLLRVNQSSSHQLTLATWARLTAGASGSGLSEHHRRFSGIPSLPPLEVSTALPQAAQTQHCRVTLLGGTPLSLLALASPCVICYVLWAVMKVSPSIGGSFRLYKSFMWDSESSKPEQTNLVFTCYQIINRPWISVFWAMHLFLNLRGVGTDFYCISKYPRVGGSSA